MSNSLQMTAEQTTTIEQLAGLNPWAEPYRYLVFDIFDMNRLPTVELLDNEHVRSKVQKDLDILTERSQLRLFFEIPLVGDYVINRAGKKSRITVSHPNQIQDGGPDRSFHMFSTGAANYSGTCGDLIEKQRLQYIGNTEPGMFWIFSGGSAQAYWGVSFYAQCKVWKEV